MHTREYRLRWPSCIGKEYCVITAEISLETHVTTNIVCTLRKIVLRERKNASDNTMKTPTYLFPLKQRKENEHNQVQPNYLHNTENEGILIKNQWHSISRFNFNVMYYGCKAVMHRIGKIFNHIGANFIANFPQCFPEIISLPTVPFMDPEFWQLIQFFNQAKVYWLGRYGDLAWTLYNSHSRAEKEVYLWSMCRWKTNACCTPKVAFCKKLRHNALQYTRFSYSSQ